MFNNIIPDRIEDYFAEIEVALESRDDAFLVGTSYLDVSSARRHV